MQKFGLYFPLKYLLALLIPPALLAFPPLEYNNRFVGPGHFDDPVSSEVGWIFSVTARALHDRISENAYPIQS